MSPILTPLDEVRINNRLNSTYWRVNLVDETGSTQDDLVQLIRDGRAVSGDVMLTEFQHAGRGRLRRKFIAPPGSALLFSALIVPSKFGGAWGWLPLMASQSVHAALRTHLGVNADISVKWPNDLLLNGRKIAGLLCERVETDSGAGVVIGIGLNVSIPKEALPVATASSLNIEGFLHVDREELLVSILQNLTFYLQKWESRDASLQDQFREICSTLGQPVQVELPGDIAYASVARDVNDDGALCLEDGSIVTVGDVVHLRVSNSERQ